MLLSMLKPALVLAIKGSLVTAQVSTSSGTLAGGPANQGTCTASGSEAFLCSNGAYCSWVAASSTFSCVGGSGEVSATTPTAAAGDASSGPPGLTCMSHLDHWDCTDASGGEKLCEFDAASSVWMCEGASEAAGSICIVHGGHTHGDCSGQCNGVDLGNYDMPLHIASIFVLLIASIVGVGLPLVAARWMGTSTFKLIFDACRHFGSGVLLSTALIHLLYHSFVMFSNACLGELHFEPAAAAITLGGLYFVFFADFTMMRWLKSRGVQHTTCSTVVNNDQASGDETKREVSPDPLGHSHESPIPVIDFSSTKAHWDVCLLEAGIIFHSIIIGVSLGTSGGDQWIPLFVAIVFHQMFEGLALGSRIGQLIFSKRQVWHKWLMIVSFVLITPIGICIGIGVHSFYNANSGAALLSIGILDALSAGILLYASLIELLYHDFFQGSLAYEGFVPVARAIFFVFAGTICMSVLGKWA